MISPIRKDVEGAKALASMYKPLNAVAWTRWASATAPCGGQMLIKASAHTLISSRESKAIRP
jgi:hypothetical protein